MTLAASSAIADRVPFETDVFVSGADGYNTYRIPSIITTKKGVLLAFSEGRKSGRSDAGNIDLVMRRSQDAGKTWSKMHVLWDDGNNTCGNPCPVVDQSTGTIWLLLTWNLGSDHEKEIMAGKSKDVRRVYVTHSKDEGVTWDKPKEISKTTRKQHWRWYATGPGRGIQLTRGKHKGRLVIPCNHSDHSNNKQHHHRAHVIYSDDKGKTWKLGGTIGERTNESTIVELSDGTILDNMRSYHGKQRRAISYSRNGGQSWSKVTLDNKLIEPVCQGNIIRHSWGNVGKGMILFSNPASARRDKMTVRLSRDDGKTWPVAKQIYAGSSAYSCMTILQNGQIGILYERENYKKIVYARFPLQWLMGKQKKP